ncbi:MAG: RelA/SpoT domain-containing protein [Candidatus Absconditabacterales bacterium]
MSYIKSEVNRAGDILRKADSKSVAFSDAIKTYSHFRQNFGYVLNTFQATLRKKLKNLKIQNFIVSQRLKRVESVVIKLKRKPMDLCRMQDIGGLRVVVNSLKDVYKITQTYIDGKLSHKFCGIDDYIKDPKSDGYRSLHIKYETDYGTDEKKHYKGLKIELQIRTKIQHSWATAVEIFSTHFDKGLKTGGGKTVNKNYFNLISQCFAILEHGIKIGKNELSLFSELKKLENQLHIIPKLSLSKDVISTFKDKGTILVMYLVFPKDGKSSTANVYKFSNTIEGYKKANTLYVQLERNILVHGIDGNAVLVSGVDLKKVRLAYPNYFMDATKFIENVRKILDKVKD